jgi:hypothetical protein
MNTNGIRTRTVRGRKYPDYDKQDMDILAAARMWLNDNGMKEHSAFTPEESDRRVKFYQRQIEAKGQITRWLAPAAPRPKSRYNTRFTFGDALGKHMTACMA